ncbi:hypothetical protein H2200_008578 [Cladophialophora chaetospira]|uniref:Peptidase A1 domain-containing protein n=1 Tax=Cladophialophora chaetospira TaxID=386627 RepID=A0AA38X4E1_9EURO|nr:hypothetical protein H2200_008578 [Cladophialophora chaetospira]
MRPLLILIQFLHVTQLKFVVEGRPSDIVSRGVHKHAGHSLSLKRHRWPEGSLRLQGTRNIVDNQHMKYVVPVAVGDQILNAEIDTGSSDTWFVQTGCRCYHTYDNTSNAFVTPVNSSVCNFGPTYTPGNDFTLDSDIHQLTCYGAGVGTRRCVFGSFGFTNVTINGFTAPQQIIGAVNETSNYGMGLPDYSGILGLGFSGGTMAYNSTTNASTHYSSLVSTLFNTPEFSSRRSKQFSLALSRDASNTGYGGTMTIGGVASLTEPSVNATSASFTSAPLQIFPNTSTAEYSWYSIYLDGFEFGGQMLSLNTSTIIDSGYNGLEIPREIATALNDHWSPPGNVSGTTVFLDCAAKLDQPFGMTIGGATYYIQFADLVGQMANGTCYSLVIAGLPPNGYSIGDPLLKNTLAVFDWGEMVMSFYPRMYYAS